MTTLVKRFNNFLLTNDLLSEGQSVLVAVSGGLDSVVLTKLFKESKIKFSIAHCNFKLRGKESDEDETLVRELANKLKVPFYSIQFNTKKFAEENKLSIQEAARNLRYEWFEKVRIENKLDRIATAHHLNDSIETFFINSIRGTGLAGMQGIPKKNGHLIRPLLFAKRQELLDFAKKKKIVWREDSSNFKDDYLRNDIRHNLIPILQKKNPGFEDGMQRSLAFFGFANEVQKLFINDWKKKNITTSSEGSIVIKLKKIYESDFGPELLSAVLHSYSITNLDPIKILNSTSGKIFQSKSKRILFDRDSLILKANSEEQIDELMISHTPDRIQVGNLTYDFERLNASKLSSIPRDKNIHIIDAGKLTFPLKIRRWQAGDSFYPLGMSKRKKISDFLVDEKVNRFLKEMTYVLLSEQDIVCILGHRIDNRFKLTDETVSVLYIEEIYG